MPGGDGVGERRARTEPGAGQEHQDAQLTQHQVGALGDLPRDRSRCARALRARARRRAAHHRHRARPGHRPAGERRSCRRADQRRYRARNRMRRPRPTGARSRRGPSPPAPAPSWVPTTRTRSPSCRAKSSWATRSSSPRRTRVTVTPNRPPRSSSDTRMPASRRFDTTTRRKSSAERSSARWRSLRSPIASQNASTVSRGPSTTTQSPRHQQLFRVGDAHGTVVLHPTEADIRVLGAQIAQRRQARPG